MVLGYYGAFIKCCRSLSSDIGASEVVLKKKKDEDFERHLRAEHSKNKNCVFYSVIKVGIVKRMKISFTCDLHLQTCWR